MFNISYLLSKVETLAEEDTMVIGRRPTKEHPLTVDEIAAIASTRYNVLRSMFYENGWTFREFLTFYNNRYTYKGTTHVTEIRFVNLAVLLSYRLTATLSCFV